jgi:hypothetical protein
MLSKKEIIKTLKREYEAEGYMVLTDYLETSTNRIVDLMIIDKKGYATIIFIEARRPQ